MAVVKDTDLTAYMSGIRLPPDAQQIIDVVLDGIQGDLEEHLGYPVLGEDYVTETVSLGLSTYDTGRRDTQPRLLTEQWPIAEVLTVTDTAGTPVPYTLDGTGRIRLSGTIDQQVGPYVVTYRPGLPPRALAQAKKGILSVASREMQNKHDDTRSTAGLDGRQPSPLPEGWQKEELKRFSRWRRRGVFSRTLQYGADVAAVTTGYGTAYGVVTAVDGALETGTATSW